MAALDVVQATVITFGNDRGEGVVGDADSRVAAEHPADDAIGDPRHIERIGQGDGIFEKSRFGHPRQTSHFSGAIQDEGPGWDFLVPDILSWHDDRDAGSDWPLPWLKRSFSTPQGHLPDLHSRHISNGIQRAGLQLSECQAEGASAYPRFFSHVAERLCAPSGMDACRHHENHAGDDRKGPGV